MPRQICTGLNVVEIGHRSVATSLAGMMLADNGARVVKIEPPEGDATRTEAPSGFLVWNRGKESVVCDLREAAGRLAKRAEKPGAGPGTAPGSDMTASRYALMLCTHDGRWISLSPQQPHQAQALLRAVDLEWTLDDARFTHAPFFRTADEAQEWEDVVSEKFRSQTYDELEAQLLMEADVPFELCRTSEEALDHPQIIANGEVIEIQDPILGLVREVGPVARFSRTPASSARSAPPLGDRGGALARAATTAAGAAPEHALSGFTIVEFGYFYAMPYAMTIAASLGARVIKLEDAAGDPIRQAFGGESGSAKVMEGKESLSVDLKSDEGRAVVHRLIERADAFVLGFRPGVAERLGIDYDTLSSINPRLVYVHAAGYGATGPYAHRPVYANTAMALSGSVARHAGSWMDRGLSEGLSVPELQAVVAPHLRGLVDGDSNASLAACSALLFGLTHQRRTGEGQFVATSMIGGNLYAYTDDAATYEGKPPRHSPDTEQHGLGALYRLSRAQDAWVFVAATDDTEWSALLDALGRTDLADDPRFVTAVERRANDDDLASVLSGVFGAGRAATWERVLTEADVGCAVVSTSDFPMGSHPAFVAEDPGMLETGMSVDIDHPVFGKIRRHGLPVHFSETPGRIATSYTRGEHTMPILHELGYAPAEIEALENNAVVFGPV